MFILSLAQVADESLAELAQRERSADIKICDFVSENICNRPLFYTINHPVPELVKVMVLRVLKETCLKYPVDIPTHIFQSNLLRYSAFAINNHYAEHVGFLYRQPHFLLPNKKDPFFSRVIQPFKPKKKSVQLMNLLEYIKTSYALYENYGDLRPRFEREYDSIRQFIKASI